MKDVYKFLDSLHIKKEDIITVAVSYGPDSMFLLDLLKNKYKENKIICCHVHHNHREESNLEKEALEKYCMKNNIIFEFMKIDKYKNNKFTEEEARKKRYEFFDKVLKKYNSKYLFTAHHGDDLIETILMKISRGSSLKGYSGINLISKRDSYSIIRPLLYLTKDDINKACIKENIPFAVDNSNTSDEYKRNRYRKYVLPKLKDENKLIHRKFVDFSLELKKYDDYVSKMVLKIYPNVVKDDKINISLLLKEDDLIIEKVIEKYLFSVYKKDIGKVTSKNKNDILKMLKSKRPNSILSMPNNKKLIKDYNKIYFADDIIYNNWCFIFDKELHLPNGYVIKQIDKLGDTTNFYAAFNSSEISLPIIVRTKNDGDRISVLNLSGFKKLKDIYIDEKLSMKQRHNQPVVTDSNDKIIWLPGLKKSKYDRSKRGNYDIILEYYKEEQ